MRLDILVPFIWLLSNTAAAIDETHLVLEQTDSTKNNIHYDERFASGTPSNADQKAAVRVLMQTCLATFRDLGIETWLMRESLLGWWWNKRLLPWDKDANVMISEPSLYFLASYYNMTTYYYKYSAVPEGRSFLLDISPHYTSRAVDDAANAVDARWIDMESGIFIDISVARYNVAHPKGEGAMTSKDGHEFMDTHLFPLISTKFEGVDAKIPYKYQDLLVSEYGAAALATKKLQGYHFDDEKLKWVSDMEDREDL